MTGSLRKMLPTKSGSTQCAPQHHCTSQQLPLGIRSSNVQAGRKINKQGSCAFIPGTRSSAQLQALDSLGVPVCESHRPGTLQDSVKGKSLAEPVCESHLPGPATHSKYKCPRRAHRTSPYQCFCKLACIVTGVRTAPLRPQAAT